MKKFLTVNDMTLIAVFTAIMAVCSWISLDLGRIEFTLQTFAVFVIGGLLGAKKGTISVLVYILIGAIGVPVFAGATGGLALVTGYLGGYLLGFIPSVIIVGFVSDKIKMKKSMTQSLILLCAMLIGDCICFLIGGLWFKHVLNLNWSETFALSIAPYIVPDIIKMIVAVILINRVKAYVKVFH